MDDSHTSTIPVNRVMNNFAVRAVDSRSGSNIDVLRNGWTPDEWSSSQNCPCPWFAHCSFAEEMSLVVAYLEALALALLQAFASTFVISPEDFDTHGGSMDQSLRNASAWANVGKG